MIFGDPRNIGAVFVVSLFFHPALAIADSHSSKDIGTVLNTACGVCDGPDMPAVGHRALSAANNDAYKGVERLLPAAESGDVAAQVSIGYIMQDWLRGYLRGRSKEPFTWRESWSWWRMAAYEGGFTASMLGGAYRDGMNGLPKNKKLGECLENGDSRRSIRSRVSDCFKKYAGMK